EYYDKLDDSPAYYAAIILHPYYKTASPRKVRRPKVLTSDIDDAIDGLINPSASINNTIDDDEFERWKRSEPRAEKGSNHANNPIKYWVELRDRYPNLSKLALDVLSIPALSCECERLFSELGDLLEPRRRAIKPQLLAATQCVRRWQRAGLGDSEVAAKSTTTDDEIELLYDLSSWGGDYHET
ncbi:Dimer-Tnp-hAT domain containing protein, partial [Pyrenophora tritici-repentis]